MTEQLETDPLHAPIWIGEGFVRLVDHMGDDAAVVQAARVSYGAGTKTHSDDKQLIRYLVRMGHSSPLEMCEVKLHIKMPMHVARQLIRHRTANVNEVSTRYSEVSDEFEYYASTGLRMQSKQNKQGSGEMAYEAMSLEDIDPLVETANQSIHNSYQAYRELIGAGVAREQARNVLPLATYTEMYWKMDLHNMLRFVRLRSDSHAQKEIRDFSDAISEILEKLFPLCVEAYYDYVKCARTFSRQESNLIQAVLHEHLSSLTPAERKELFDKYDVGSTRERIALWEYISATP